MEDGLKLQGKVKITDKVTLEEEMTIKNVPKRAQLEATKKVHLKHARKRENLQLNAIRDKKAQSKVARKRENLQLNAIRDKKAQSKVARKRENLQLNAIRDKKAQSKVVKRDSVVPLKNAIRKEFAK